MKTRITLLGLFFVVACSGTQPDPSPRPAINDGVFVQMFEWRWNDLARECEEDLGPADFAAVQTSPPQELLPGPQWWPRYQPVS